MEIYIPLLLVASLLTEELREVTCGAEVVAVATDRFLLFWVAVRLQSVKAYIFVYFKICWN